VVDSCLERWGAECLVDIVEYRGLFVVGSLVLILIMAAPTLGLFIRIPDGSERFSEVWLLGPEGQAENYPFNVSVNESYYVYVGVGNHLGRSAYYRIYVKFRNQTVPLIIEFMLSFAIRLNSFLILRWQSQVRYLLFMSLVSLFLMETCGKLR